MQTTDYLISASNEGVSPAIPRLIDAAVASFDADRDTSRSYLLRALAILRAKRGGCTGAKSARRSESRGGLLAWQLNRVVDYIEAHLADKITGKALAALINVSVSQLFRAFKVSVGVTPFQYIAGRRVELACTMMRKTREPLAQVAVACGLCDQAHFSRTFRRVIGTTPSAWRRYDECVDGDSKAVLLSPGRREHSSVIREVEMGREAEPSFAKILGGSTQA
jgi:AraC family transcriptional regulator